MKKILVVDTNVMFGSLLEAMLLRKYEVFSACGEFETFEMLGGGMVDLILISEQENINGLGLFQEIKNLCPNIPVIGIGDRKRLSEGWIKNSSAGFLKRPFKQGELINLVQSILEKRI